MLPFALKLVWCILCLLGTVLSWAAFMALGSLMGTTWAPLCFCIAVTMYEGMFCLGMIWRMDPSSMPRAFCIAQTLVMEVSMFFLGGICMALCIATSLHILKPKKWGNIQTSFKWRSIYVLPVIIYPLAASGIQLALAFKTNAIQAANDMYCDATNPLWVRLTGHAIPVVLIFPSAVLSVISIRRVIRTLKHVERARQDDHELPRQMRREHRHLGLKGSSPTSPCPSEEMFPPSPGRQLVHPRFPVQASHQRMGFHLPFFRRMKTFSGHPSPPLPSPSPRPADADTDSVASSSFPTFAPMIDPKDKLFPTRSRDEEQDRLSRDLGPWEDDGHVSSATTSVTGHDRSQEDLKTLDQAQEDDGTFHLSYIDSEATPTREWRAVWRWAC
ncbi:unnamed protein product [Mycena citricolor]|uniref:Uncharacterized protein n=1 Tax=Mycena citricolor TaxID=2018698 RepID=A0AAD2H9U6_9AGAR|nr:unnamed protein product [Mycena citricolor]